MRRIALLTAKGSNWHVGVLRAALIDQGAQVVEVPVTALRARTGLGISRSQGYSRRVDKATVLEGDHAGIRRFEKVPGGYAPPSIGWLPTNQALGEAERIEIALEQSDAVVVRALPGGSLEQVIYRIDALHLLAKLGVPVINHPAAIERAVDKFYTLALLEDAGLPVPPTIVAERYDDAMAAFAELGGDVVLKPLFGSEGRGMVRLTDADLAHRAFRALELGRYVYYLQRFVPHGDADIRAFVLGDQVLAAMRRSGAGWKSNVAAGARAEPVTLTAEMAGMAVQAALALGTAYAGVDLLPAEDGRLYVIEVNSIPGWRALQSTTTFDIAAEIARYMLAQAR